MYPKHEDEKKEKHKTNYHTDRRDGTGQESLNRELSNILHQQVFLPFLRGVSCLARISSVGVVVAVESEMGASGASASLLC